MFKYNLVTTLFLITTNCANLRGAEPKWQLIKETNVCKRHDPEIAKCYLSNKERLLPLTKNGIPQMNIVPLDPFYIETIDFDLVDTERFKVLLALKNTQVFGVTSFYTKVCNGFMSKEGIQLYEEYDIPKIIMKSNYTVNGHFLLFNLNGSGNLDLEASELDVKAIWNSTRYIKNNKEHLNFTSGLENIDIENLVVHFHDLFGTNAYMNDYVNYLINQNLKDFYKEFKPRVLEIINDINDKIANAVSEVFPFDVLFPEY